MTLRLKNGRFATAAKVRTERNPFFHRALISAIAAFKRAGFEGETHDPTYNERVIELNDVLGAEEIAEMASRIETARLYPDVIYNVSFQDTEGRWFAVTEACETVELCALDIIEKIAEMMLRYQRSLSNSADARGEDYDPDEYAITAVMVSVYKYRR